ncbi:hypothetical protein OG711_38820 (plasmid) [Streptomyces uncialis]|nr:hypothetical protein [Streptomyces uncialis]WTE16048.1 hypothetical protein OG924_37560 [Streptomyces uncialis]
MTADEQAAQAKAAAEAAEAARKAEAARRQAEADLRRHGVAGGIR